MNVQEMGCDLLYAASRDAGCFCTCHSDWSFVWPYVFSKSLAGTRPVPVLTKLGKHQRFALNSSAAMLTQNGSIALFIITGLAAIPLKNYVALWSGMNLPMSVVKQPAPWVIGISCRSFRSQSRPTSCKSDGMVGRGSSMRSWANHHPGRRSLSSPSPEFSLFGGCHDLFNTFSVD